MEDRWTLHGREFGNCSCAFGCPCQFNAASTHGSCEGVAGGIVEEGHFNDVRLDGLHWVMIFQWPGEIAEGNGKQQMILDESATPEQREAMRKITHGEATEPGATHFFVFNSTMSKVFDPIYAKIEVECDVEARKGRIFVPGLVEAHGSPITDPHSGDPFRAAIQLPNGFEYRHAEMGSGSCKVTGKIQVALEGTYGQFNEIHMTQSGVIR